MRSFAASAATTMLLLAPSFSFGATADHLKCYKVKDDASAVAYTATLTPANPAFAPTPGCTLKSKGKLLCVDTEKTAVEPTPPGAPEGAAGQIYLCYKTKCTKSEVSFTATDQFGVHQLKVGKAGLLCTPVNTTTPTTTTTTTLLSCGSAMDCTPTGNECTQATCVAGNCGVANVMAGTPVASQFANDCQSNVCDGMGSTTTAANDGDVPVDGNSCTSDVCTAGAPSNPPVPNATPCSQGGGSQCVNGNCAQVCGDGVVTAGEGCDDLNNGNGDGCSSTCTVESGYDCTGAPSTCTAFCGNGVITAPESCDDGDATGGDGCSATCQVEIGYNCTGTPSVCTTTCGDGITAGTEQCDDSNLTFCDGCSPSCRLESAFTYSAFGNVAVVDDAYNGTLATMACMPVTVNAAGDSVVDYVCPRLGMTHPWVGDLVVKLVSPTNTVVTLMSLPGISESADNGTSASNEGSDLAFTSPIRWIHGGPKNAELMGNTLSDAQVVCQDDAACVYQPHAGAAAPGTLAAFVGLPGPGSWRLCVGDSAPGDVGTMSSFTLVIGQ